ncbi:hypothetical protein [Peribacillus sp. NPDC096540]|uniref:hypothetical protein n=1 Tax=Peribacillus sp. NPDC096540 TaxID=3390612 RepID=UPI003D0554CC
MMGRVSAATTSLQTFSMLIAPAVGSLLAKWLGVSFVLMSRWGNLLIGCNCPHLYCEKNKRSKRYSGKTIPNLKSYMMIQFILEHER